MEKLKALLRYCSFVIQIPNKCKRKSREVSKIVIKCDQRELYTTATKCSFFSWHFWVREHFAAVFCMQEGQRGEYIVRRTTKLLQYINRTPFTPVIWESIGKCCLCEHKCLQHLKNPKEKNRKPENLLVSAIKDKDTPYACYNHPDYL